MAICHDEPAANAADGNIAMFGEFGEVFEWQEVHRRIGF
jgi:hypothetical protein